MARRLSAKLQPGDLSGPFAAWRQFAVQRIERAMLIATDDGAKRGLTLFRERMTAAGLGNLGMGLTATSDLKEGRGIHHYSGGRFSASGLIYVRSGSERTRGALRAYTAGASIQPVRSRWLWIPTDDIPVRANDRHRLTPAKWSSSGLDKRIGPLVQIRSINGNPLLVVIGASTSLTGKMRSAKALTKTGRPRAGQRVREMIVAFIGIPRTSRVARIDVRAIHREIMGQMPGLFSRALGRT